MTYNNVDYHSSGKSTREATYTEHSNSSCGKISLNNAHLTANELANRARQYTPNACVHEPDPNYIPFSYNYATDEPWPPPLSCSHRICCWVVSTWYLSGVRPFSFHCSTVHCLRSSRSLHRFRLLSRSFLQSLGCCPGEWWRETRSNCLAPASGWLSVRTQVRYTSAPSDSVRTKKSDWWSM